MTVHIQSRGKQTNSIGSILSMTRAEMGATKPKKSECFPRTRKLLDVKVPPIGMCQATPREKGGAILTFDGEVPPLGLRLLKEHLFTWNLEGRILDAPMPKSCWFPYDFNEIMRFRHSVNRDIPEWGDEAEFPPTPWGDRVVIRVKSQIPPVHPLAPLPADGEPPSSSPAPGLPATWTGPTLGQAPRSAPTQQLW
jgi:hypothetical protein